jgi:hypothetical protein
MGNDTSCVALALKVWKTQLDRADKLFGALSSEEVLREIATGRNRVLYLWGHLTAAHDASRTRSDASHNPWREVARNAECRKSARSV